MIQPLSPGKARMLAWMVINNLEADIPTGTIAPTVDDAALFVGFVRRMARSRLGPVVVCQVPVVSGPGPVVLRFEPRVRA